MRKKDLHNTLKKEIFEELNIEISCLETERNSIKSEEDHTKEEGTQTEINKKVGFVSQFFNWLF